MISFRVNGTPIPQGSLKHIGAGRFVSANKHLTKWRTAIAQTALQYGSDHRIADPLDEPLALHVDFYLPRPRKSRFPLFPAGRPDLDKLVRAVFDGLTTSTLIADDSRFVAVHATKNWAVGCEPGCHISIYEKGDMP